MTVLAGGGGATTQPLSKEATTMDAPASNFFITYLHLCQYSQAGL